MGDAFYEINPAGRNDLTKPYASFHFGIRWKPEEISCCECANGYIVQEIIIEAPEYLSGFHEKKYYEAWNVENGVVTYQQKFASKEDDVFSYPETGIEESLNKEGQIIYYARVFWVDDESPVFEEVNRWNYGTVIQAGNLIKSSLVFNGIDFCKQLDRTTFRFEYAFKDIETIRTTFIEIGRNFYGCDRKYERQNFECFYKDAFIREGLIQLFEAIINQLDREYSEG